MKRIAFFLVFMFSFACSYLFGQNANNTFAYVTLKGLPAPERKDGQQQSTYTTSNYITRNPTLVSNVPNSFEVVQFTAGVSVGDKYIGPFNIKGNTLTQQVIDGINNTKGPGVKVFLENIKVKGPDGTTRSVSPVILKYDQ